MLLMKILVRRIDCCISLGFCFMCSSISVSISVIVLNCLGMVLVMLYLVYYLGLCVMVMMWCYSGCSVGWFLLCGWSRWESRDIVVGIFYLVVI